MASFLQRFIQDAKIRNIVILIVMLISGVLLFGFYWSMRAKELEKVNMQVGDVPSEVRLKPGAKNLPKEYLKTLLKSNQQEAEHALKTGQSSMPILIDTGDQVFRGGEEFKDARPAGECYKNCMNCCKGQQNTGTLLNDWVKKGKMSAEAAAKLSQLQDKRVAVSDYAKELNKLVRTGKVTPEQAQKLLAAYRNENQKEVVEQTTRSVVDDLVSVGGITPKVATEIQALAKQNKSADEYQRSLDKLVKEGKITSEQASRLLETYHQEHPVEAPAPVKKSGQYDQTLNRLAQGGKISADVSQQLNQLSSRDASAAEYATNLNALVKAGRLSPEAAKQLLSAYREQHGDVKITATGPLANLERAQQQQILRRQDQALMQQQAKKQSQNKVETTSVVQRRQQGMHNAFTRQMQSLITAWNVSPQVLVGSMTTKDEEQGTTANGGGHNGKQHNGTSDHQPPMVKAGTIMFAVLDTGVNTDEPGPVMATLVSGTFKGGKLLGNMTATPDNQRVMLKFTTLSMPDWAETVPIEAVAINPDTAHTALASSVDNHYLLRYGSLFGSNFVAGYAQAVKSSGSTTVDTAGSSTTTNPALSAKDKLMVGLGAVGTKLSEAMTHTFNRPATVRVEAGVGIGILFMNNVADFKNQ